MKKTPMPRKPSTRKSKELPVEQHKRFVEIAKKLGAAETQEEADEAFKRVVKAHARPRDS